MLPTIDPGSSIQRRRRRKKKEENGQIQLSLSFSILLLTLLNSIMVIWSFKVVFFFNFFVGKVGEMTPCMHNVSGTLTGKINLQTIAG